MPASQACNTARRKLQEKQAKQPAPLAPPLLRGPPPQPRSTPPGRPLSALRQRLPPPFALLKRLDWRAQGVVGPVLSQVRVCPL